MGMDRISLLCASGIAALNYCTHFWGLGYPNQIVFDETGYGKNINAFTVTKNRRFDIHPPHASMLMGFVARLMGYRGGAGFEKIGDEFPPGVNVAHLRTLSAFSGMVIPPCAYLLAKIFGASEAWAILAAVLLTFDNALLLHTRIIQPDGIMVSSTLWSMLFAILSVAGNGQVSFLFIAISGALSGLAIGTKSTGVLSILTASVCFAAFGWHRDLVTLAELYSVFFIWVAFIYLLGWMIFFDLKTGNVDDKIQLTGKFFRDLLRYNAFQVVENSKITKRHHYESHWYLWPFGGTSIRFWKSKTGRNLWLVGNPVVWMVSSLITVHAIPLSIYFGSHSHDWRLSIMSLFFLCSYLPFAFIRRALFLYHYLTPMVFSVMLSCVLMSRLNIPILIAFTWGISAMVVFERICPFTFGLLVRPEKQMLLSKWVYEWPTQLLGIKRTTLPVESQSPTGHVSSTSSLSSVT
jgi:dolichyl-phosphate-mannose--protein O-mannosyl transferase